MFTKAPTVYTLQGLLKTLRSGNECQIKGGHWVPARPLGMFTIQTRLTAAWLAFTGRADVVKWPEQ